MCKSLRKIVSGLLIFACSMMICVPSSAAEPQLKISSLDPYAEDLSETVTINEMDYTYKYFYNNDNNKAVNIENETTGEVYQIEFIEDSQGNITAFDNGQIVGSISKVDYYTINNSSRAAWVSMGPTEYHYITWAQGTAAAVVGALIGAALGGITGSVIVGTVGTTILGTLGSQSTGCTISLDLYYMNLITAIQYMYVFGLTDTTNIYHGPFTVYTNPYPYV